MITEPNFYHDWPTSAVDEPIRLQRMANAAQVAQEPPLTSPSPCQIVSAVELPPEALYWRTVAAYDAALHLHGYDSPQCRQNAALARAVGRIVRMLEGVE